MPIVARTIKVTKLFAARAQLNTAITLWFQGGDHVSIMALAYAAHEIFHRAYRSRGFSNLLFDSAHIKEEHRSKFVKLLKEAPNFFKHANRNDENDAEAEFQFSTAATVVFILFSITAVKAIEKSLTPEEEAFLFWCRAHQPSWFLKDGQQDPLPAQLLQQLRSVNLKDFFEAFLNVKRHQRN